MRIAHFFVEQLEKNGVKHIFGLPGEELKDILYALEKSKIQFVTTRHEQGASFAAAAYGRILGEPGVCISTLGPGATNLVTGVAEAKLSNFPLVAINAQDASNPHQYIDTVKMFEPISKWSTKVANPKEIPSIIQKATFLAKKHSQGSTHIEISEKIVREETYARATSNQVVSEPEENQPDTKKLQKVAEIFNNPAQSATVAPV